MRPFALGGAAALVALGAAVKVVEHANNWLRWQTNGQTLRR